ncbi:MAG: ArnT family glycosyltransferase, partial [Bradymonadaceae bacterium]
MPSSSSNHWLPHRLSRWDWFWASALFIGATALFLSTMQMGFTRDEGFYFHAAGQYIGWFEDLWANLHSGALAESFTQANVDKHWGYNPEHPVLMKSAFALSHKIFHELLGWMSPSTALRFPTALTGAGLISVLYLFGRQLFGRTAGFVAAGALLFQPRFFFHAHMACFDVPITFFWVATVYAYWRSYDSRRWVILTGVLFGLGLSTKLNAFFLPAVLGLHWFLVHFNQFGLERRLEGWRLKTPPVPKAFVSMAILGPLLFYALWPRHWFDTFARVKWYINFHLTHEHYFVDYFGMNLQIPPFPISYPWVMTAVTVPATILFASVIGLVYYLRRRRVDGELRRWGLAIKARKLPVGPGFDARGSGVLLAINLIFPIALISMPDTPIFGGTK